MKDDDPVLVGEGAELQRVKERLRQLEKALETMQVGVTITDVERRILYVNPSEAAMHGYRPHELIGRDAALFAPAGLRQAPMAPERLRELTSWRRESVNVRRDGTSFPVEILSDVVLDDEGEAVGLVSISQDITWRKAAEAALRESEERYALATRGSNDGIWDWNLETDEIYFSERWQRLVGGDTTEIGTTPEHWWRLVHPEDLDELRAAIGAHLEGHSEAFVHEYRMLHSDGSYRWMLSRGAVVYDPSGKPTRLAGSQTDVTERKVHDPLTGLPNRALFVDRLGSALRRNRRRPGVVCAVLFLDLDRFKLVNDSLGHPAGDRLLIRVARSLESCLRPADTVARLGGDEFTILLEDISDAADAVAVADRIHQALERPLEIEGREVFTTVSIGIALASSDLDSAEDLLRDADNAMYRAKAQGAGRHQLFDQEMRHRAVARLQLETDLRHALERRELLLHYQPIVTLDGKDVVGFEALLRWQRPDHGMMHPRDFIPVAEETGLILPIGKWVLNEACRQLKSWQREYPAAQSLRVSVNLSSKQFGQPDLPQAIERGLARSGLAPECLEIEITESVFVERMQEAVEMVRRIRALGVLVSIDDFGTGYSSLGHLHSFPVDGLKIDRSFISRLDGGGKPAELVQTIIRMADALGIQAVAEGVETEGQESRLRAYRCGLLQGFVFSRPQAPDTIARRFLASGASDTAGENRRAAPKERQG